MKNVSTFSVTRSFLITAFALGGFIFSIAFIGTSKETHLFKSIDSHISLANPQFFDTKMVANVFNCTATLIMEEGNLVDITKFQFNIPVEEFNSDNQVFQSEILGLFKTSNTNTVSFDQQKVMVLPVMKMIHIVGELNIGNVKRPVSFQLAYTISPDQSISIKGKQTIFLHEFGIILPADLQNESKDELILEVDIKMVDSKLLGPKSNFLLNF
ncbi:YceI family protein [Pedobacter sp. Du54]|uniref:YceI family protein n=1 Tax=Pedobacter anseongensis TaxID=3133439 RepID=UPI0030B5C3CE